MYGLTTLPSAGMSLWHFNVIIAGVIDVLKKCFDQANQEYDKLFC
jgi:hypothetical protein